MMNRIFWVFIFCLVSPLVLASEQANIEKIYDKQCAVCHGNKGDGKGRAGASLTPAPTDFTSVSSKQLLTKEKIVSAIRDGIAGTSMVGYGRRFDTETIQALADFVQVRFMGGVSDQSEVASPGKEIYAQHCAVCHGDNGSSAVWAKNGLNPPPRDFTSQVAKQELSRDRMILSVTHGRPGTGMMSFAKRLTSKEIERVVDFIRQQFMVVGDSAVTMSESNDIFAHKEHVDMAGYPKGLIGDAEKGKLFFDENCYVCHGKKGDGKGPRAYFNTPPPRDFTTLISQQELTRSRLFLSISKGRPRTVMPAWSTVLNEQQIADIAEYVYQAFLQPQKKKP